MKNAIACILASGMLVVAQQAAASGVSPYLPLNMSPEMERQIERVLILADKTVIMRPIPAAVVLDALPIACERDEALCRRVRAYLDRYTDRIGLSDASVSAAVSDGAEITLPNARGMTSDSSWSVAARAYWQPSPYALVSLGGVAYDDDASPAGSMLSLGFEYAQLDVGYRDHWFSPFKEHAMLISTQAKPLPSVTLSNYAPITGLGFRYELFLAEMEHSDRIRAGSRFTSGEPYLSGIHASVEPATGYSLGMNRLVQYGGGERGGRSLSDFWHALVDPEGFDERGNVTQEEEFGNQVAAWTSAFVFPGPTPFSAYMEYGGEDRAYEGNYRSFSNAALSFGVTFPQLWRVFDLTYEASDWQNSWYVHSIYMDGLTNDGHVLGHWGGDARRPRNGVGAQSHMLRIGWLPPFGGRAQLRARTINNEEYSFIRSVRSPYDRAYDLTIGYSRPFSGYTLGTELMTGKDVFGESFARLEGYVRLGDEWSSGGGWAAAISRPEGAELFVDAGMNANRVRITIDAVSATDSGVDTETEIAPHFAIGARRAVTENSDLGARVEFDEIDGRALIALRALDYRYRFGSPIALSAFLGAARYDLATSALGYYGGVGVTWRNLLPQVDLSLDARYADKVNRDKVLPADRQFLNVRPDSFYDIASLSLYASYRW